MDRLLQIPDPLVPYREKIYAARCDFIRISLEESLPDHPWSSEVGGQPYLPKNVLFPMNPKGRPLFFLAQINFGETPALPPFPDSGILQFYINDDQLFGLKPGMPEKQEGFRLLYFPEILREPAALEQASFPKRSYGRLPLEPFQTYTMSFDLATEWMGPGDYQFEQHFGPDFIRSFKDEANDVWDYFYELGHNAGHKIGGYAFFTQEDPRNVEAPMVLLFQLDSDSTLDIRWGDMGIANFFIRERDLVERNFQRVLYNWDYS